MQIDYESHPMSSSRAGRYKWAVVAMLWFVCFFNYADRQAIFSVFPLLKSEMHLSDVQLGIVGSAFMYVYALFGPIAGLVGDRVSRKVLIVGGLIFWSVVTVLTGFSTDYKHLVFFRAIEGFGEAFYFPAAMSIVSDYHGRETRSKAMAICQSSVYAGTIAGGTVAGFLGQFHGWRSGFYLFGGAGVVLGLVLILALREPARGSTEAELIIADPVDGDVPSDQRVLNYATPRPAERNVFAQIFTNRTVLLLISVFVCANFVASIFLTWMPSFLSRKFNMSLSMAGLNATFWLQIFSVLGVLTGGYLADRLASRRIGGRQFTQMIGLVCGVPFIFFTGYTLQAFLLVIAMAGFGYFKGMYDANIWASLYDVVTPRSRATAVGFMNSIGWLGGGTAPIAIAFASERFGMSACISATSLIYVAAAVLMFLAIRSMRRPRHEPSGFPILLVAQVAE